MLEVTLLKVRHGEEKEAQKTLPYARSCDVWAPESAYFRRDDVELETRTWKSTTLKLSRSKALELFSKRKVGDKSQLRYINKRDEFLFRNQKPRVIIERWPVEESRELEKQYKKVFETSFEALGLLANEKDVQGYLKLMGEYLDLRAICEDKRDRHIANNLLMVEHWIREENLELILKNTLNLVVEIGFRHLIEKHTTMPLKVVNLFMEGGFGLKDELSLRLRESRENGVYPPTELLAYGLATLATNRKVGIGDEELRNANFNELKDMLRSYLPDSS